MLLKPLDYLARIGLETDPEVAAKFNWALHMSPEDVAFVHEQNTKVIGSIQPRLFGRAPYSSGNLSRPPQVLSSEDSKRLYGILAKVSDGISNDPVYLDKVFQIYLDEVAKHEGTPVLDICAGTGLYSAFFAANLPNRHFVGLDLSDEMLGELERKVEQMGIWNLSAMKGDFLEMKKPGFNIPTIIAVGAYGAVGRYDTLRKASGIISSGGSIVLMDEVSVDWKKYKAGEPQELFALVGDARDCAEMYGLKLINDVNPIMWQVIEGYKGKKSCIFSLAFQKP